MEELQQIVRAAANRPEIRESISLLYRSLGEEIERRRPVCISSGRCCHFDDFGHRLYVTTIELAAFTHDLHAGRSQREAQASATTRSLPQLTPRSKAGGCPFQIERLCSVHAIRPFGCRVFFCDATATEWQNQMYERFHAELKKLHQVFDVPYRYLEWRAALIALDVGGSAG